MEAWKGPVVQLEPLSAQTDIYLPPSVRPYDLQRTSQFWCCDCAGACCVGCGVG